MNETEVTELTPEELAVLKELAQDRMAYSRVWRKVRNFGLAASSAIVSYLVIVEDGIGWLQVKLGF